MHRLSTQTSRVEKEKEKAQSSRGQKSETIMSPRFGVLPGNDLGRRTDEGAVFRNGYEHENHTFGGGVDDIDDNPWVSASSISTPTLRSRHHGRASSRDFGYLHDEAADGQRDSGMETRRRRRRSRSAIAGTSKHPLHVDMDDDGSEYNTTDRHLYRTQSHTQSSHHRGFSSSSDHRTRPSLQRAIGSLEGGGASQDTDDGKDSEGPVNSDVDVIVHKVSRTDTLAGIALKYKIPLAQLRKTNKLWTNDSIHLRQVLYIPLRDVSSSSSAKILTTDANTIFDSGEQVAKADTGARVVPKDEIRKIPHSKLSFFPPSGNGVSGSSMTTSMSTSIPNNNTRGTHPASATASSSPSFSFISLIQGLNNATQEIKSRLSIDSYSRHSSDPGDDGEIELSSVKKDETRESVEIANEDHDALTARTPSTSAFVPNTPTLPSGRLQNHAEHLGDSSIPTLLPSLPPSTPRRAVIRSIQLQPSPEMKIPTMSSLEPKNDIRMRYFMTGHQQTDIDSEAE